MTKELPKIKGYKIDKHIAIGDNSNIYHAYEIQKNREVAIKILNIEDKNKCLLDEFVSKFNINFKTESENLIKFYDINLTDDDKIFFVMEYLEGECLKDILQKKKLSYDEILNIIKQVGSILENVHNKRIFHKDLSTNNIFICKNNIIKVLDFGLVDFTFNYDSLYMSPEIYFKQQVDNRSDLYSFGLIIYEMITGHKAIKSQKDSYLAKWHKKNRIPDVWLLDKTIPSMIRKSLLKVLSKNPDKRYQNIDTFLIDIERGFKEEKRNNTMPDEYLKDIGEIEEFKFPAVDPRKRIVAYVLDLLIVIGIQAFIYQPFFVILFTIHPNRNFITFNLIVLSIIDLIIFILYFALFESSNFQASPGKLLMKLKVTDNFSKKIDLIRALKRNCAKLLSALIIVVSFILTIIDEDGKTLHDKFSGTIVMDK